MFRYQSRRRFVISMGALASSAFLTACGDPTNTPFPVTRSTTGAAIAEKSGDKAKAAHWTYEGEEGPTKWAELSPENAVCGLGKNQTPIDITNATKSSAAILKPQYGPSALVLTNNGHTIQVNYDKGSSIEVAGKKFELAQFHFHTPSEHKITGKVYPMELHLVHKSADNALAVIGIMMEDGPENAFLAKFWDKIPTKEGEVPLNMTINASDVVPANSGFYTYQGSLTTPPCSEGVSWMVMKQTTTISKAQVERFAGIFHSNARPIQALNGRVVEEH